jgi:hypothetical protein
MKILIINSTFKDDIILNKSYKDDVEIIFTEYYSTQLIIDYIETNNINIKRNPITHIGFLYHQEFEFPFRSKKYIELKNKIDDIECFLKDKEISEYIDKVKELNNLKNEIIEINKKTTNIYNDNRTYFHIELFKQFILLKEYLDTNQIDSIQVIIDFITCNMPTYVDNECMKLHEFTDFIIRYSTDKTGNTGKSKFADWHMEKMIKNNNLSVDTLDKQVNRNIKNTYFNDTIKNWNVVLSMEVFGEIHFMRLRDSNNNIVIQDCINVQSDDYSYSDTYILHPNSLPDFLSYDSGSSTYTLIKDITDGMEIRFYDSENSNSTSPNYVDRYEFDTSDNVYDVSKIVYTSDKIRYLDLKKDPFKLNKRIFEIRIPYGFTFDGNNKTIYTNNEVNSLEYEQAGMFACFVATEINDKENTSSNIFNTYLKNINYKNRYETDNVKRYGLVTYNDNYEVIIRQNNIFISRYNAVNEMYNSVNNIENITIDNISIQGKTQNILNSSIMLPSMKEYTNINNINRIIIRNSEIRLTLKGANMSGCICLNDTNNISNVSNTKNIQIEKCVFVGDIEGDFSTAYLNSVVIPDIDIENISLISNVNIFQSYIQGNIIGIESGGIITNCKGGKSINTINSVDSEVINYININECFQTLGNIIGNKSGGIVSSYSKRIYVKDCYTTGDIMGNYCGGILGYDVETIQIEGCYTSGEIIGKYSGGIGTYIYGISGFDTIYESKISKCFTTGNFYNKYQGGILGYAKDSYYVTIENCYSTGRWSENKVDEVIDRDRDRLNYYTGGIVGLIPYKDNLSVPIVYMKIYKCYTKIIGNNRSIFVDSQDIYDILEREDNNFNEWNGYIYSLETLSEYKDNNNNIVYKNVNNETPYTYKDFVEIDKIFYHVPIEKETNITKFKSVYNLYNYTINELFLNLSEEYMSDNNLDKDYNDNINEYPLLQYFRNSSIWSKLLYQNYNAHPKLVYFIQQNPYKYVLTGSNQIDSNLVELQNSTFVFDYKNVNILFAQNIPSQVFESTIKCLEYTSRVSVLSSVDTEIDNSIKNKIYYLNQPNIDIGFEESIRYELTSGEYKLTNIPKSHPIAILNNGANSLIEYYGNQLKKITDTILVEGEIYTYDFYYGDITINVYGDFGTISYYCLHHGYMGGKNKFIYNFNCKNYYNKSKMNLIIQKLFPENRVYDETIRDQIEKSKNGFVLKRFFNFIDLLYRRPKYIQIETIEVLLNTYEIIDELSNEKIQYILLDIILEDIPYKLQELQFTSEYIIKNTLTQISNVSQYIISDLIYITSKRYRISYNFNIPIIDLDKIKIIEDLNSFIIDDISNNINKIFHEKNILYYDKNDINQRLNQIDGNELNIKLWKLYEYIRIKDYIYYLKLLDTQQIPNIYKLLSPRLNDTMYRYKISINNTITGNNNIQDKLNDFNANIIFTNEYKSLLKNRNDRLKTTKHTLKTLNSTFNFSFRNDIIKNDILFAEHIVISNDGKYILIKEGTQNIENYDDYLITLITSGSDSDDILKNNSIDINNYYDEQRKSEIHFGLKIYKIESKDDKIYITDENMEDLPFGSMIGYYFQNNILTIKSCYTEIEKLLLSDDNNFIVYKNDNYSDSGYNNRKFSNLNLEQDPFSGNIMLLYTLENEEYDRTLYYLNGGGSLDTTIISNDMIEFDINTTVYPSKKSFTCLDINNITDLNWNSYQDSDLGNIDNFSQYNNDFMIYIKLDEFNNSDTYYTFQEFLEKAFLKIEWEGDGGIIYITEFLLSSFKNINNILTDTSYNVHISGLIRMVTTIKDDTNNSIPQNNWTAKIEYLNETNQIFISSNRDIDKYPVYTYNSYGSYSNSKSFIKRDNDQPRFKLNHKINHIKLGIKQSEISESKIQDGITNKPSLLKFTTFMILKKYKIGHENINYDINSIQNDPNFFVTPENSPENVGNLSLTALGRLELILSSNTFNQSIYTFYLPMINFDEDPLDKFHDTNKKIEPIEYINNDNSMNVFVKGMIYDFSILTKNNKNLVFSCVGTNDNIINDTYDDKNPWGIYVNIYALFYNLNNVTGNKTKYYADYYETISGDVEKNIVYYRKKIGIDNIIGSNVNTSFEGIQVKYDNVNNNIMMVVLGLSLGSSTENKLYILKLNGLLLENSRTEYNIDSLDDKFEINEILKDILEFKKITNHSISLNTSSIDRFERQSFVLSDNGTWLIFMDFKGNNNIEHPLYIYKKIHNIKNDEIKYIKVSNTDVVFNNEMYFENSKYPGKSRGTFDNKIVNLLSITNITENESIIVLAIADKEYTKEINGINKKIGRIQIFYLNMNTILNSNDEDDFGDITETNVDFTSSNIEKYYEIEGNNIDENELEHQISMPIIKTINDTEINTKRILISHNSENVMNIKNKTYRNSYLYELNL